MHKFPSILNIYKRKREKHTQLKILGASGPTDKKKQKKKKTQKSKIKSEQ